MRMMKCLLICGLTLLPAFITGSRADEILDQSGVKGGLVVVAGSGNPELLASLRVNDSYLVQGLEPDRAKVESARKALRSKGVYGPITVKHWTEKHLPYADNIVRLLVFEAWLPIPDSEIMRVLTPQGVAMIDGKKTAKPVPADIDEWTHFLHDASNNAVAKDSQVGPPRHLRWDGGPKYSRNHEIDVSVVAVVSAQGRFFYIVDEGPAGTMGRYLPQKWALMARDAFSGVILWKRPMEGMGWPEWKPGMSEVDWTTTRLTAHRRLIPLTLPRRLVAVGQRVFVTMGYRAPLIIMDAATGRTVKTVEGTTGTDEIIHHNDTLIIAVHPKSRASVNPEASLNAGNKGMIIPGTIMAVSPESGGILWKVNSDKLIPLSLTAAGNRVFFHTSEEIVCLDRAKGTKLWSTPDKNAKNTHWATSQTMIAHDNVLLVGTARKLEAFSAETGELVWSGKGGRAIYGAVNMYVIDGLIWMPLMEGLSTLVGRDLMTGNVKRTIELPKYMYTSGHHFRCYRGKATERYLLENKRGIEMLDLTEKEFVKNDWVRGVCRYGVMPCNGLIYSTPTPCSCYPAVQLTGFNALASKRVGAAGSGERLYRGPAFGKAEGPVAGANAWPTLRHNILRSGATQTKVALNVTLQWKTRLASPSGTACKLTQPIIAEDKLFVASKNEQTVFALDSKTGKILWSYTVDGRMDSPPTYHKGALVFGSRNGGIYSLCASDGALAWRYRVASGDEQIVSYNQLESVWPAHGSTLVLDDVVYAAAGRNVYLDDGICLVGLEAATGRKLYEAHLKNEPQNPATDKSDPYDLDGAKSDVLASDGTHIFMQRFVFDKTLKNLGSNTQKKTGIHPSAGYLDDLAWNRNAWRYEKEHVVFNTGNTAKKNMASIPRQGQLLVHDTELLCGVKYFLHRSGQSSVFYPGQKGYLLFADYIGDADNGKASKARDTKKSGSRVGSKWNIMLPVRIRAMTKADQVLFVAGPPDVIGEDPLAAFEERGEGILQAYSANEGKKLSELKLNSQPVFDGLIAANGKLFMSTADGSVVCFGK